MIEKKLRRPFKDFRENLILDIGRPNMTCMQSKFEKIPISHGVQILNRLLDKLIKYKNMSMNEDIINNSNMTWFFSPIKSTDTNLALFSDKS